MSSSPFGTDGSTMPLSPLVVGLVGFETGAEPCHVDGVSREDERAEHLGGDRKVRVDDIGRLAHCEQHAD